jgi:DNA repair exonuclease SbcCD ATPase subunit/DNA repair exonuclease SbcCD nuclease subunit
LHLREKGLTNIAQAWHKAVSWAHDNKVDLIVQAGDVFHHPNVHGKTAQVGTLYEAFLNPFKTYPKPIQTFLIPGNHDMGGPQEADALAPFSGSEFIVVSRKPEVLNMADGFSICSMPWVNKANLIAKLTKKGESPQAAQEKVTKALAGLCETLAPRVKKAKEKGDFVLFVGHLEVTGSNLGNGEFQADGSFEFSSRQVAELGCDAYALAHIHIRQHVQDLPSENDGYLGTLCHLDFSQHGLPCGYRLLEVSGGKIVKDEFVDNDESPKYISVESLEGIDYRPGHDIVQLKGYNRPESLPKGIQFQQIVMPQTNKRLGSEYLDSTMPLRKLLSVWKDFANCPIDLDTLEAAAEALKAKAQLPCDAVGCLDRINGITLHAVTCHGHTSIDLKGVIGLCAIEGPNGSGKTTTIESIPLALYGEAPSRTDLPLLMALDGEPNAYIELAFESAGTEYIARRNFKKTPKTFKHEAYLWKANNYNGDKPDYDLAIAGPKVEDVKNRCSSIVGDMDLVLAGIFSSQTESGNLVDLDSSDRKELFAKLLGSDKYLAISDLAKESAKTGNASIETNRARIERLKIELAAQSTDEQTLESLKQRVEDGQTQADKLSTALEKAQAELATLSSARQSRLEAEEKISSLKQQQENVKSEGVAVKSQKVKLEAAEKNIKQAEESLAKARQAKEKLDELGAKKAAADEEVAKLRKQASDLRLDAAKLRSDAQKKAAQAAQEKNKAYLTLRSTFDEARRALADDVGSLELTVQAKRTEAESAKKRSKLLEGFPDVDACKACPLAKDGLDARGALAEIVKEGKALVKQLEDKKKALAEHDANAKTALEAALAMVPRADELDPELVAEADKLEGRAVSIDRDADAKVFKVDTVVVSSLKADAAGAKAAEAALDEAKNARVEIAKLDAKLDGLKAEYKRIDAEISSIKVPEEVSDEDAKAKVAAAKTELQKVQDSITAASREFGRLEASLEAHQKRRDEMTGLEKKVAEREAEVGIFNALHKAFSKDGIPQLIVDSVIPHYQEIMTDLLKSFGNKWAIQARTQREVNKGASVKEVLDILVDDGHGLRDIKTYSGGEKRLLKNIIRIAFSLLQAERSGKGLKVLVLDEATENMDGPNVDAFMKLLTSGMLSGKFNQVFVVSHNDYVLNSLPNRIIFSRNSCFEPTTVETVFTSVEAKK